MTREKIEIIYGWNGLLNIDKIVIINNECRRFFNKNIFKAFRSIFK